MDYVLNYSNEVPLKYHELKAEFIVRLSRNAGHLWMPQGQLAEEPGIPEKLVHDETSEKPSNNYSPENALQEHTSLSKKKKSRTDVSSKRKGKAPKRVVSPANSDDDALEDINSDVEEDDLGEEFWEDNVDEDFIQWQPFLSKKHLCGFFFS